MVKPMSPDSPTSRKLIWEPISGKPESKHLNNPNKMHFYWNSFLLSFLFSSFSSLLWPSVDNHLRAENAQTCILNSAAPAFSIFSSLESEEGMMSTTMTSLKPEMEVQGRGQANEKPENHHGTPQIRINPSSAAAYLYLGAIYLTLLFYSQKHLYTNQMKSPQLVPCSSQIHGELFCVFWKDLLRNFHIYNTDTYQEHTFKGATVGKGLQISKNLKRVYKSYQEKINPFCC